MDSRVGAKIVARAFAVRSSRSRSHHRPWGINCHAKLWEFALKFEDEGRGPLPGSGTDVGEAPHRPERAMNAALTPPRMGNDGDHKGVTCPIWCRCGAPSICRN